MTHNYKGGSLKQHLGDVVSLTEDSSVKLPSSDPAQMIGYREVKMNMCREPDLVFTEAMYIFRLCICEENHKQHPINHHLAFHNICQDLEKCLLMYLELKNTPLAALKIVRVSKYILTS